MSNNVAVHFVNIPASASARCARTRTCRTCRTRCLGILSLLYDALLLIWVKAAGRHGWSSPHVPEEVQV